MKTNIPFFAACVFLVSSCSPIAPQPYPSPSISQNSTINTPKRPNLQRLTDGHYRVLNDWPVTVNGKRFLVQKGYNSNGITAPKSIKMMLGDHINAPETWTAVFHDWCFTQKNLTRLQCDIYYIQLMRDFKISPQKIQLMGTTVKGYSIYKGN